MCFSDLFCKHCEWTIFFFFKLFQHSKGDFNFVSIPTTSTNSVLHKLRAGCPNLRHVTLYPPLLNEGLYPGTGPQVQGRLNELCPPWCPNLGCPNLGHVTLCPPPLNESLNPPLLIMEHDTLEVNDYILSGQLI